MRASKFVTVSLVMTLVMQLSLAEAGANTISDEQFQVPAPTEQQMRGYYVNELAESTQSTSTFISTWVGDRVGWKNNEEAPTDVVVCSSTGAPECDLRIMQQFLALLPMCESATTLTCIEDLYAEKNGQALKVE